MMRESLFPRCVMLHDNRLFGVIAAVAVMLLPTVSTVAQDTSADKERDRQVRVGFYFSGVGVLNRTFDYDFSSYYGSYNSPEYDDMPYPVTFISIRYNGFQGILGWGNDSYTDDTNHDYAHHNPSSRHNEHMAQFVARYNFYPGKKFYIFGGPVIWRFHRNFSLKERTCTEYGSFETDCVGEIIFTDIKTDRPDGKSTTLGINAGFGIEYTLFNLLVFSHEIEFFRSACKYKDFICKGGDFKFLGLHVKF